LSNPYGPHWPTERKSYGLINQFIARALAGEPIEIFGEGSQRRDYIHVDDFMTAILSATATAACWGQTFNIGAAQAISIREAVETIANQIEGTVVRFTPWPEEHLVVETGDYQSDLSKLKRFVHLPPQLTFDEGLRRTLDAVQAGLPIISKKTGVSKAIITIYRRPPVATEVAAAGANAHK
jgi:nucleoside-diphosphate-sugar epimerase